jgi:hypothetical protein
MMGTCQASPCPTLPVVNIAIQFCAMTSECIAPATCGPLSFMGTTVPGLQACNSPSEGGTEGGSAEGGSSSGGSEAGTEAGSSSGGEGGSDAPSGG